MQVGFTGTKDGYGERGNVLKKILIRCEVSTFRHGMCIGSDTQAHNVVRRIGRKVWICGHPPAIQKENFVMSDCDEMREPKHYLVRNHDIVDESEVMIATPKENQEVLRSGTWATIRYAKKEIKADTGRCKRLYIIYPDGRLEFYDKNV